MTGKFLSQTPMFPFLTLDESTLYYWTLSAESPKKRKHIDKWALAVPANKSTTSTTSTSQAPKSTSTRAKTNAPPSLTFGSSGRLSAPSVLSDNVKIITRRSSEGVKVETEPVPAVSLLNNGGLSDNDETKGEEWTAARNSPPKGKRRINSEVFFFS